MTEVVHVTLNKDEFDSLAWLADRYTSADFLWQHTQVTVCDEIEQPAIWTTELTPADCVEYLRLLADENGDPCQTVPTCAGGSLKEKLMVAYHDAWSWTGYADEI